MSEEPEVTPPIVTPPAPDAPVVAIMTFWIGNDSELVEPNNSVVVERCPTCFALVPQKGQQDHQRALHGDSSSEETDSSAYAAPGSASSYKSKK